MQKTVKLLWKIFVLIIVCFCLISSGYLYSNRDEIITSKISMKYFEDVINSGNVKDYKNFVANSNKDVLYNNFVSKMENNYFYEGVTNFNFKITNTEVFGDGKYQCYFSNAFENYIPKCDLDHEGRYMNYFVDIDISYDFKGKDNHYKEKGLVVFAKDMEKGNYFTWKLVRFDRYIIEEK